jgi:uncharacterized protein
MRYHKFIDRWRSKALTAIKLLLVAIAILFATSVYAQGIEPRWFNIKTIDIDIAGLDPAFADYKIVQLTDLHARSAVMNRQQLERVATLANQQHPDLIALTGDYITKDGIKAEAMLANAFGKMQAKDGVVAIMGNHDRGDSEPVERALATGKVKVLNNDVYSIERQGKLLNIAGVDDVWFKRADLPKTIDRLPQSGTNILLAHEPDFADTAESAQRFALQLSGHSHGGQVVLPFMPRVTPPWGKKYFQGLYHIGEMQLYVSPGVGTTGPPKARFNCRPEISVIVLHRA